MTTETQPEVWKDIKDYPGYQVSDQGRIRIGLPGGGGCAVMHPGIERKSPRKPRYVYLKKGGRFFRRYVHRLVALAFIGPQPDDLPAVKHRNGSMQDNRASNLYYGKAGWEPKGSRMPARD